MHLKNLLHKFLSGILNRINGTGLTSTEMVERLRNSGVLVGENVLFRYPDHTVIDVTRPSLVEFGNNIDINDNFSLMTHDFSTFVFRECYGDFVNSSGRVKIGNNVVFGRDVSVFKGVTIGDNCIIGAGSIVTKSIASGSVAVGNPARVICSLDEYYQKRKTKQLSEALEYGRSIIERYGREPVIGDFAEEWTLFLTEKDYENPECAKHVDFRMGKYKNQLFEKDRPFNGFEEFKKAIISSVKIES